MTLSAENDKKIVVTKRSRSGIRTRRRVVLTRRLPKDKQLRSAANSSVVAIQAKLTALDLPLIASWKVEEGVDASGEGALWAWGTVTSDKIDPRELTQTSRDVQEIILNAAARNISWVYVRFRDPGE